MKKLFTIFLVFMGVSGYSQFYVPSGETIFTTSTGELTSKENVSNNGTIYSLEMNSASAQTLSGTGSLRYLKANDSADISLSSAHTVTNNGIMLTAGKLIIGNYNITTASITNDSATRYIKTNGTGLLRMNATTGGYTKYPIGNSSLNYIRVYNNNATEDTFSVRVQDTLYANAGSSSGSINNSVNRTWYITKKASNTGSGLDLEFNWNAGDVKGTLSNATLYEYNGTKWVKSSGTQSVSGNQLTITGYTDTLGNKQFMIASSLGATVSVATSACQNATGVNVTFTGSNGTAPYTFTYTLNGGSNQTVSTTSGNSVTVAVNTATAGNIIYALVSVQDGNQQNSVSGADTITINASSSSSVTASACSSYTWHGTTYTSSNNTATWTGTNAAGCDSVVTLNLTIKNATSSTETASACGSYVWHGTTYTASNNTATWTGTNVAGCDSVVTLNLTIKNATSSTETVSACGSYVWHGTTYTSSNNTATWTGTNSVGCDSVVTLNLTIKNATSSTETVSACGSYAWHGTTYTSSNNTATWTGTNSVGCDSVVTLNLTIKNATSSTETVSACGSYVWHGTTYTSSNNTATWTGTNAAGCDSVVTLNLTINYGTHNSETRSECDSYIWHSIARTSSGTYTYSYTNGDGCASVDTLHLTITTSTTNISTVSACNSYTWSYNGATYTSSGIYNVTTGCHTETLNLTINNCNVTPAQPGLIQGGGDNNNICKYVGTDSILTYYVDPQPTTAQYVWYFPANTVKIIDGNGNEITYNASTGYTSNNQVRVKFLVGMLNIPNVQKIISVKGKSLNGLFGPIRSRMIMSQAPLTPDLITASPYGPICSAIIEPVGVNQTAVSVTYKIPKVISASSYNWYVDAAQASNVVITHPNRAGINDTIITVMFTNAFSSCNLYVQSVNICGSTAARTYSLVRSVPSSPGLVSGPNQICANMAPNGQAATYSVPSTLGVLQYNWSVPANSINVIGQGTPTLSFIYPSGYTGGTIGVTAQNACGISSARTLSVSRNAPGNPSAIDVSPVSTCPNRVVQYSISAMPYGATYIEWTYPAGVVSIEGQGTTSLTITYPSTGVAGTITAKPRNECMIYSSASSSVSVKLSSCTNIVRQASADNTTINVVAETMNVKVFPNPTTNSFNVVVGSTTPSKEKISVRLLDVQGRAIRTLMVMPGESVNLGADLKSGSYMLEVKQGGVTKTTRVVKY